MSAAFSVLEYSNGNLKNLLSENSKLTVIENKLHTLYFKNYFLELQAQTILAEYDYIDHDYLEDFAGYYVKCFRKYKRNCTRLHFFSKSFSKDDFERLLASQKSSLNINGLQNSYLGFIVVKPLPQTIIGRTCLKTYDSDNNRRHYPITHKYEANLFGIPLAVKSLPFQEQDNVVAACATSALWTAFNGTSRLFNHSTPSPVSITKLSAAIPTEYESQTFPSKGLTGPQIVHAIRSVGLEPFSISANDDSVLKATSYAYLRSGLPLIMGVYMFDVSSKTPKFVAAHAVTLTGFSMGIENVTTFGKSKLKLKATRINELYAHDDQVGPFARMIFDNVQIRDSENKLLNSLYTSQKGSNGEVGSMRAAPYILFIPLYHKIRIPYNTIHNIVNVFNYLFDGFKNANSTDLTDDLEWDIYLSSLNDLKSSLIKSANLTGDKKKNCLLLKMPRFVWRVTAYYQSNVVLEFLFDATDIEQGKLLLCAIEYDENISLIIRTLSKELSSNTSLQASSVWPILEWFANQPD